MTAVYAEDLGMLRHVLEEQRQVHAEQLAELSAGGRDGDGPDLHTRTALIRSSQRALSQVTDALERMDRGTYGRCESCGSAIPAERLEALPHARSCASCRVADG